jgi:hypothetical protein
VVRGRLEAAASASRARAVKPQSHVQKKSNSDSTVAVGRMSVCPAPDPTLSQLFKLTRHCNSTTEDKEPVSILKGSRALNRVTNDESKPVPRSCGCSLQFTSLLIWGQRTEIKLKEVPNREYSLHLFVDNVRKELQEENNRTWTPAQRLYVL